VAVYTHLDARSIETLLADYDIGALDRFEGIGEGVENTNFHLFTRHDRFVLTVFERRVREADLPYFLGLADHLGRNGVKAPKPITRRDRGLVSRVAGKPAVIATYLEGRPRMAPTSEDCRAAGAALATLHRAGTDFPIRRDNDLSLAGWRRLAEACGGDADRRAEGLAALIADELAFLGARWPDDLTKGAAHLDFFPDNVFFAHGGVSGIIDFYFAATDALVYDLAIGALSWSADRGRLDRRRLDSFIDGYDAIRTLGERERRALPVVLRGAATRFLLTRLYDWLNQVEGAVVAVKEPLDYRDLLLTLRDGV
jgi:homoserine kinase type II